MEKKLLIAPSILSADFSILGREVNSVEKAMADLIHVDVMDGHFVPNLTIGPAVVASLKKWTSLPLDVHLMIKQPWLFLDDFIRAGSSIITVHREACSDSQLRTIAGKLKENKLQFGVSLNPATPLKKIETVLKYADLILIMSVNPGFAGQSFIPAVLPKISALSKIYNSDIEIDGGITDKTAPLAVKAGVNILVSGSYIFKSNNRKKAIESLKKCKK